MRLLQNFSFARVTARIFLFFLCVGLFFFGAGCVSSGKVILTERDPIALVSVVSNRDINWQGEEALKPGTAGPFTVRLLNSDPDLAYVSNAVELINSAERIIREQMAASDLINLAEKEQVLFSRAYRDARMNKYQVRDDNVKPFGYEFVDFRDRNFPAALASETGVKRCLFVEFNFTQAMASGIRANGSFRANVEMKVTILDARGKTLYQKIHSMKSLSTAKISSRTYSESGLMELFDSAIMDTCQEFLDSLKK